MYSLITSRRLEQLLGATAILYGYAEPLFRLDLEPFQGQRFTVEIPYPGTIKILYSHSFNCLGGENIKMACQRQNEVYNISSIYDPSQYANSPKRRYY